MTTVAEARFELIVGAQTGDAASIERLLLVCQADVHTARVACLPA